MTTVARAVSPASAPNLGRGLRIFLFAVIGIIAYFLVLSAIFLLPTPSETRTAAAEPLAEPVK